LAESTCDSFAGYDWHIRMMVENNGLGGGGVDQFMH
jgi:hypothetical protein